MNRYLVYILFSFLSFSVSAQVDLKNTLDYQTGARMGNLLWAMYDGIMNPSDYDAIWRARQSGIKATPMTLAEFYDSSIPYGWRLPTKNEFIQALKQSKGFIVSTDGKFAYILLGWDDRNRLCLGLEQTVGQWGSRRSLGGTLRYLVKEGVVTLKFSRAIDDHVNGIVTLADENSMYYIVDEYVEFSDSWNKPARVRLVSDL